MPGSIHPYARSPAAVGTPIVGPGNSPELGNIGSNGSGSARRGSGALGAAGLATVSGCTCAVTVAGRSVAMAPGAVEAAGSAEGIAAATAASGTSEIAGGRDAEATLCAQTASGKDATMKAPAATGHRIDGLSMTPPGYGPVSPCASRRTDDPFGP